ncbi:hypothetical protein L6452_19423 [Arctium lappa]|uniref:Uncharacterized protein n=1 Tax=Arctium lappa TaxID=4217 RepID=A0ACB9B9S6_ARCLA|nr:hypothetical protein L6452_19423 [Arctium lappa]
MLPDFMYYMTELKDLSYLTQQCNGAQGSVGFPAWGTINKHIEVWVRLHLESRSTLADWSIMLPDFMYYMTELKDLSYLTQQCNGAQGSAGFPAWGTINKVRHCGSGAPPPLRT